MSKNTLKIQSFLVRSFSSKAKKKNEEKSIWDYFKKEEKPDIERCRKREVLHEDPDLSRFGGQPYRTCGSAYIVQKDVIPPFKPNETEEDRILKKIEADLSAKDTTCDPMPQFQSVEKRMLDLTERRLHPLYRMYMEKPKSDYVEDASSKLPFPPYKCKTGEVKPEELPDILKFNMELLENKNIFADFKKVELPKQMVRRLVEMEKNRKPTLEKKKEEEKKIEVKE